MICAGHSGPVGKRPLLRRHLLIGAGASLFMPAAVLAVEHTRLVAVDWAAAETVLALGLVPLAISDVKTFRSWLPEVETPSTVLDLGSRAEPNMELLARLRPDGILISNWQASLAGQLEQIAPTVTVTIVRPPSDPLENAETEIRRLGALYGRGQQAEDYAASTRLELSTGRTEFGRRAMPPVFVGVLHENGSQIFLYGEGSWVHTLLLRSGLRNALNQPTSAFGNALVDLAVLAEQPDAVLLYLDQGDRTRRALRLLAASTLWQRLSIVRAGRASPIPAFYPLGGLPSVRRAARVLTAALSEIVSTRNGR